MNTNENKSYRVNEAAKKLGVHPITVYHWLKNGTLRGYRFGPKMWRIPASEIERMTVPFADLAEREDEPSN